MMPSLIRSNFLILISLILYGFALLGVIYITDRANLSNAKAEYCKLNDREVQGFDIGQIWQGSVRVLSGPRPDYDPEKEKKEIARVRQNLLERIQDIVESDSPVYEIAVSDIRAQEILKASRPEKIRERRSWENTVIWNFKHSYSVPITRQGNLNTIGQITVRYTNPLNDPQIAAITRKHRPRILGSIAAITILFIALFYFALLPIRNVTAALKAHQDAIPAVLRRARTTMERAYNQVACDALLMRLEESIRSIPQKGENYERYEVQHQICRAMVQFFEYAAVWILKPGGTPDTPTYTLLGASPTTPESLFSLIETLSPQSLQAAIAPLKRNQGAIDLIELHASQGRAALAMCALLPPVIPGEPDNVILAVAGPQAERLHPPPLVVNLFERAVRETRRSLIERQGLRRSIARQRSEANINIARHLGHDLTNIIATSKLDLIAVRNFLQTQADLTPENGDDPRRQIFTEALEALLKNTQFLQEIVNLYRSFGYVRTPQYEQVHINDLVKNIAELFAYSTSTRIHIRTEMADEDPVAMVEPRLIRLCLFNLMTNSLEAIQFEDRKRGLTSAAQTETDEIVLSVRREMQPHPYQLILTVADTGPGIRDPQGELIPDQRLRDILSLGVTTKSDTRGEGGGEGLGLDWVRTIIEDFHQGKIIPRNRPEGGASFTLQIPLVRADAMTKRQEAD